MLSKLNETPQANRLHIGFFGRTNAGKSSVLNALTNQAISLVSEVAGTTTDPVYKAMELLPIGPVVLIDTAGLDDATQLAKLRTQKTKDVLAKTDLAVLIVPTNQTDFSCEKEYLELLKDTKTIIAYNDFGFDNFNFDMFKNIPSCVVNPLSKSGIEKLKQLIIQNADFEFESPSLTKNLVHPGDTVLLVAPQDIQAPKGRLILPQVQVLRDLLDNQCNAVMVIPQNLEAMLANLANPPSLVITDSQMFKQVNEVLSKEIPLTSFSILLSKQKGDIQAFVSGARAIAGLKPNCRILIAESCTHHAQKGDIAREKLPEWISDYVGGEVYFDNVTGDNLPDDLSSYSLILHCGGCMANRKSLLAKIAHANNANVPIANFGTAIAFLNGILDRVVY